MTYVDRESQLYQHFSIALALKKGEGINAAQLQFLEKNNPHNLAVVHALGQPCDPLPIIAVNRLFDKGIEAASSQYLRHFSRKHYINFLLDTQQLDRAKATVTNTLKESISEVARINFRRQLAYCIRAGLQPPYVKSDWDEIAQIFSECIDFYEAKGLDCQAGLLFIELAEVKELQQEFKASKSNINKAIMIFKQEALAPFLGEALVQKASLLYHWAKIENPSYFKAAIPAFQEALKIFTKDDDPQKYADIKHQMAMLYSEVQTAENEKPIWAAFSAAAFQEALAYYKAYPNSYEFANVAHNYATALMGFPEARLKDNLAKANALFEKAFVVRDKTNYPLERALTLLNQLELLWIRHNDKQSDEYNNLQLMMEKVSEIPRLVNDPAIIAQAVKHKEALEEKPN